LETPITPVESPSLWPPRSRTGQLAGAADAARLPSDGSLVTLALHGVEPAFALLCARHSRRLRSLIAARVSDPGDVPDVVQETHLAMWRALPRFDIQRHFESWLTTIAVNKCRDWGRRRSVRRDTLARFQGEVAGSATGWTAGHAESLLLENERLDALHEALAQLPAALRDPLIRTALHQVPQAAVARDLNITVKAVEMRVRRARQRLHNVLTMA